MRVLVHPDPCILEHELVARIDEAHAPRADSRTLVLVPTRRLADHVLRKLAARRAAWLGVRVLHFRALALSILEAAGVEAPCPLSERLRRALVEELLRSRRAAFWTGFVGRRPGALGRVAAALDDLREAGVDPRELRDQISRAPREIELADLYADYARELGRLERLGLADEAGLVAAARPRAPSFAREHGAIFLHGTYELIGVHLELLRELDRAVAVTVLSPAGSPATGYAASFLRRFLLAPGEKWEMLATASPENASGLALEALYEESSHPPPAAPQRFAFRSTQGAASELEVAARHALGAIADGCPPHEIAIVARSLEPYAASIDASFGERNLRFTSPCAVPLRRQPYTRDLLLLLRVLDEDFPRRATAELLRSARLDWSCLSVVAPRPSGDLAESWSRRARIGGGLEEWARELPRWAARPVRRGEETDPARLERAALLVAGLRALAGYAAPVARGWADHARWIRALLDALLPGIDGVEGEALQNVLADMARLESIHESRDPVEFRHARSWLETAIDGTELRLYDEDRGGIRVLDAMQLRGLTFRRVMVLGLNAGIFPRRTSPDPILDDDLRRRLREGTGRPLPVRAEGVEEERLLLGILLGSSRERLEISWLRSGDAGRPRSLSPALREIARLATGRPDVAAVCRRGEVPAHPRRWLEHLVDETGALEATEERLLLALRSAGDDALAVLEARFPELGPGLRMHRAIDAFGTASPEFDARTDRSGLPEGGLSVSQLEKLGRCPLQFFFATVLRVREAEPEPEIELERRDLGSVVHALLAEIYTTLDQAELLVPARLPEAIERAEAIVADWRSRLAVAFGEATARRFPVFWEHGAETWQRAVGAFVRDDLERIAARGLRLDGVEREIATRLDLGREVVLPVHGRLDRVLASEQARIVGDYKTGSSLGDRGSETHMLQGRALQVPLYHLLAAGSTVELLGVGPKHDPAASDSRLEFRGFGRDVEEGFRDTLRVLAELVRAGRYPLDTAERSCSWCRYDAACRRKEPPTRQRERHDPDGRVFAALQKKSTRRPRLDDLGASDG